MKYDIGDHVSVKARMIRSFDVKTHQVSWKRKEYPQPKQGRIVGQARRYDGERHFGYKYDFDEYAPGYLTVSKSHIFWLVRFGMLNKEVCVEDVDLYKVSEDCWQKTPLLYGKFYRWTEKDKQALREAVYGTPRDKKGRWVREF